MHKILRWRTITTAFTVAAIVYAIRTRQPSGTFLKVPYDFRMPTFQRLRESIWNPEDPRIFPPRFFGVGWSLNLYHVVKWFRADAVEDGQTATLEEPDR